MSKSIIIGVTGHRNLVKEDYIKLKEEVKKGLLSLKELYYSLLNEEPHLIMLSAFAEGADILCAEVAFELNIDVYAVLPYELNEYRKSICKEERNHFDTLLKKCKNANSYYVVCNTKDKQKKTYDYSSFYRELGIFMAKHSHILLALWDQKPPRGPNGCGTVEVIQFVLDDKLNKSLNSNSIVLWIPSRRRTDLTPFTDASFQWIYEENGKYIYSKDYPRALIDFILKN